MQNLALTGAQLGASPSLRARNLRTRDRPQSSNSSQNQSMASSASSSSLASLNSAQNNAAAKPSNSHSNHFRFAGRNIVNQQALPALRSTSSASQSSQNLARIYSQSGVDQRANSSQSSQRSNSRDSSGSIGGYDHQRIHLSNLDFSDGDMMPSPVGSSNGVIRIEMQPRKVIREQEPLQVAAGDTTEIFSTTRQQVIGYHDVSIALQTFKSGSSALKALEQTHLFADGLITRQVVNEETGENQELLDLDDEQGADGCKTFFCSLERLMCSIGLVACSKAYREDFTNSYQVLYRQMYEQHGSRAAYLPEILDSAQEDFDHLWVNGEKYVFSDHVVESGQSLAKEFTLLRVFVSHFYQKHFEESQNAEHSLATEFAQLKEHLSNFDQLWGEYERKYVNELMVVEGDARRFIIDSINVEAILSQDHMQAAAMRQKFNESRKLMLGNIAQVNTVANVDGKGRDDFEFNLLEQAEALMEPRQVAKHSRAVTRLAQNVRSTFDTYRQLMREYQANIELVDPQLRNNAPLVKIISDFENAWCIAQNQLSNSERLDQLDMFSKLLQRTQRELPQFNEQVECRDASIFMSIPALLIMEALLQPANSDAQTIWQNLCTRFKEDITALDDWTQSKYALDSLREARTLLGKLRLAVFDLQAASAVGELQMETNHVKHLGMELQRSQPMEWNEFMTACIVDE